MILCGKDIFYCQLDTWLFYQDGHKLYLTGKGVVLSYVDVPARYLYFGNRPPHEQDEGARRWNRRQQQPREKGGYMYRGSLRATRTTAAGSGPTGPVPGASSSSEPGRGPTDLAPGKAQKGSTAKGGCEGSPSVPPQPEAFNTSDLRKSIDEVEQQQTRRRAAANEFVEVDLRVNTAKIHAEQQEALLRQTSSNPWLLFHQDVLALKNAKGNKIYSEYGDARARVVSWVSMPVRLRALIGDIGPAKWLQHPFSGYSVQFFLRAFEIGKMQGNFLLEFTKKKKKYSRLNSAGEAVLGYESGV